MAFWRKQVIDFALDYETLQHIREQREWIAREPANAVPYKNLAQLYRIQGRQEEALGLLLEAVRLDNRFAAAHVELSQIYTVLSDYGAAWRHARLARCRHGPGRIDQKIMRRPPVWLHLSFDDDNRYICARRNPKPSFFRLCPRPRACKLKFEACWRHAFSPD